MMIAENQHLQKSKNTPTSLILKIITVSSNQSVSIADELQKLANLKEKGGLTEKEFNQMKQDLIKNNKR